MAKAKTFTALYERLSYVIDKARLSFRLTAPYSDQRRTTASNQARANFKNTAPESSA